MQDVALLDPGDVLKGEGLHRLVADDAPGNSTMYSTVQYSTVQYRVRDCTAS